MAKSIVDRISGMWKANKKLTAEKQKEVYHQILSGMTKSEEQKQLYKIHAERAIVKAQKAAKSSDDAGKRIAMRELKVAYGLYHYMCSMHDAFRAMKSQVEMQNITQEFAEMVNSLCSIRMKAKPVDFAALTQKALKGFKPLDLAGMDNMVDSLIRGSIAATESDDADDAFLEALVRGEVSLETPYPSKTLEKYDTGRKEKRSETHSEPAGEKDDIMALLDQMVNSLKAE